MNSRRAWILLSVSAVVWLSLPTLVSPIFSGVDTFIFRDAGWNLAACGSFSSIGLPYMTDLSPHLYAHYTPLMPLLFGAFCWVFPRNAAAGDTFNTLLGILTAALILRLVLKQPNRDWFRTLAIFIVALFPAVFVTFDRPEALGIALVALSLMSAWAVTIPPGLTGLLVALTFLAHPFAGILCGVWSAVVFFARAPEPAWKRTLLDTAKMAGSALCIVAITALCFFLADPSTRDRFSVHALGRHSGLGVGRSQRFLVLLKHGISSAGLVTEWGFAAFLICNLLLLGWMFLQRRRLKVGEWGIVLTLIGSSLLSVIVFPAQGNYFILISFLTPLALLAAYKNAATFSKLGLTLTIAICLWHLPILGFTTLGRFKGRQSFLTARSQPAHLLANLGDHDALVVLDGNEYDLYKPVTRRLVNAVYLPEDIDLSSAKGVVNCYTYFRGTASDTKPFPSALKEEQFHKVEAAPDHAWLTLFGRRIMRSQQGWGCDLYVRNTPKSK